MTDVVDRLVKENRDRVDALKDKLWAAVDDLDDSDGFVLVATAEDVTFTCLKSTGWGDHVLELEPLNRAEVWRHLKALTLAVRREEKRLKELDAEIEEKRSRLADIQAALANALGEKS